MFESCSDFATSSAAFLPPTASSTFAASETTAAQFYLIYVDRDSFSDEAFQSKLKEIHIARSHEQQKKKDLVQLQAAGASVDKTKVVEMEIKAAGDSAALTEKKFMEMHAQRERFKAALKDRCSSTQPFFEQCNALLASFKTFPLHCFGSQTAVAPTFALSSPQISFRFVACTQDDSAISLPSKIPQLSVVIEATDVSILAFNDPVPLLIHSKVS
jgi:hypothetical protein